MLGEDSETNLETARLFGIRYLIHVGRFSSQAPPATSQSFQTINYFSELVPRDDTMTVAI
jgi:5'-nucleotidase